MMASSERSRAKNLRVAARRRSSADCAPGGRGAAAAGFAAGLMGWPLDDSGVARRGPAAAGAGLGFTAAGFFAGAAFFAAGFLAAAFFGADFLGADFLLGEMRLAAAADAAKARLAPALLPLFASAWSRNFIDILQGPLRP